MNRQMGPVPLNVSSSSSSYFIFLRFPNQVKSIGSPRRRSSSSSRRRSRPELMNFRNLDEFWAFYVTQHSKPTTRRLHFIGTILGLLFLLLSLFFNLWLLPLAPFTGYGLAWYSHFFVERNAPATFGHPLWSLLCDFRMFGLMMTGRMEKEIKRLGKRPVLQAF